MKNSDKGNNPLRSATEAEINLIREWLPDAVKVNRDGTAEWFSNHLRIDHPSQVGDATITWWRMDAETGAVRFAISRNDPKRDLDLLNVRFSPKHGLVVEKAA